MLRRRIRRKQQRQGWAGHFEQFAKHVVAKDKAANSWSITDEENAADDDPFQHTPVHSGICAKRANLAELRVLVAALVAATMGLHSGLSQAAESAWPPQ